MSRRFAVSTLGMPGVSVAEAVKTAAEHGCHGLEIRAHEDEAVHIGLTERESVQVRSRIADAGLEVACLAGYAKVCAPGPDEPVIAELRAQSGAQQSRLERDAAAALRAIEEGARRAAKVLAGDEPPVYLNVLKRMLQRPAGAGESGESAEGYSNEDPGASRHPEVPFCSGIRLSDVILPNNRGTGARPRGP